MFWERDLELGNSVRKGPSVVAMELGFSNATSSGWKKGAMPRPAALQKIATYFGCTVEYLLYGDKKEAPTPQGERKEDERKLSMLVSLFERLSPEDQNDVIFELLQKAQFQLDQDAPK